ncbi:DUF1722 domain-containing protein [Aerococcaceae bacterium DSM 111022]|nr:DUF1722 domain-containing protein [Aerococcaceae bacterium DSM 111022]
MRYRNEKIWAKYKYEILSKSQKSCLEIRHSLRYTDISTSELQEKIDGTLLLDDSPQDQAYAFQRIWHHFEDVASQEEEVAFQTVLDKFKKGQAAAIDVLENLYELLQKYPNDYLMQSTIFDELKHGQMSS